MTLYLNSKYILPFYPESLVFCLLYENTPDTNKNYNFVLYGSVTLEEVTDEWRKLHKDLKRFYSEQNIIRHEMGFNSPDLALSIGQPSKVFFLVYISTLLLASCCSLFLHVVAN